MKTQKKASTLAPRNTIRPGTEDISKPKGEMERRLFVLLAVGTQEAGEEDLSNT